MSCCLQTQLDSYWQVLLEAVLFSRVRPHFAVEQWHVEELLAVVEVQPQVQECYSA